MTHSPSPSPQPILRSRLRGWIQKNLFSSGWNSLLTVLSLALILWAGSGFLHWALTVAQWQVIGENLRLLLVGLYPDHLLWRVWLAMILVAALLGLSLGTIVPTPILGSPRRDFIALGGIGGLILLWGVSALRLLGQPIQPGLFTDWLSRLEGYSLFALRPWAIGALMGSMAIGLALFLWPAWVPRLPPLRHHTALVAGVAAGLMALSLALFLAAVYPIGFVAADVPLADVDAIQTYLLNQWQGDLLIAVQLQPIAWLAIVLLAMVKGGWIGYQGGNRLRRILPGLWFGVYGVGLWLLWGGWGLSPVEQMDKSGLILTVVAATTSIVLCFPFGVLLALGRRSELPVIRWLSIAYIELMRGLPLLGILFMAQVMLPLVLPPDLRPNSIVRAIVGFTMFSAAYLAENIRGGLQSIPKGQVEAAQALGLNSVLTVTLIVLPQALRAVIPTIVGQFISLFKDTSLLFIVALSELVGMAQSVLANPAFIGRDAEMYLFVAVIYYGLCSLMSYGSRRLELKR